MEHISLLTEFFFKLLSLRRYYVLRVSNSSIIAPRMEALVARTIIFK